jgi:NADH dehydrogenase
MSRIFVTGASGFVGAQLFAKLRQRDDSIIALDRSGSIRRKLRQQELDNIQIVSADVMEPEKYEQALSTSDTVLHLAALTGRASKEDHERVNAQGTQILLDCCRRAGVQRILFVSSIAVKWPDTSGYYYAQAKARAEAAVRHSGLNYVIVRPCIIVGRGSPILIGLERLAALPVIPVFGNGRTMVQPIYVDDVVDFILTIIEQNLFQGETLELGGPTQLSIEQLLQQIRQFRKGSLGPLLHVPIGLLKTSLQIAESAGLRRFLPFTPGQLLSFRFDGTIENNPLYEKRRSRLVDIPQMLALSLAR